MQVASFPLVCVSFRFLHLAQDLSRCDLYISLCPMLSCQLYISVWTVVMKLQGIAEINKLKVTDVLLFRERDSCV